MIHTFEQLIDQRTQQNASCYGLIVHQSRLLVLRIGSEVVWEIESLITVSLTVWLLIQEEGSAPKGDGCQVEVEENLSVGEEGFFQELSTSEELLSLLQRIALIFVGWPMLGLAFFAAVVNVASVASVIFGGVLAGRALGRCFRSTACAFGWLGWFGWLCWSHLELGLGMFVTHDSSERDERRRGLVWNISFIIAKRYRSNATNDARSANVSFLIVYATRLCGPLSISSVISYALSFTPYAVSPTSYSHLDERAPLINLLINEFNDAWRKLLF
jgi:hypothetical protein